MNVPECKTELISGLRGDEAVSYMLELMRAADDEFHQHTGGYPNIISRFGRLVVIAGSDAHTSEPYLGVIGTDDLIRWYEAVCEDAEEYEDWPNILGLVNDARPQLKEVEADE